jgi:hypothetical protein
MTRMDALLILDNPRIKARTKLMAAARALAAYDIKAHVDDIRRLLARAKDAA